MEAVSKRITENSNGSIVEHISNGLDKKTSQEQSTEVQGQTITTEKRGIEVTEAVSSASVRKVSKIGGGDEKVATEDFGFTISFKVKIRGGLSSGC